MKRVLIFILILWSAQTVFGQKVNIEEAIAWDPERPLTWADFQKKAPKKHVASAMSDINFTVKVETENNALKVYVEPSFNPGRSWVKQDDRNDHLLKHEQVHFDIYEVNARKLRKEIQEKQLTSVNLESTINKLLEKYSKLNVKVQDKYDSETDHSIKKEKQYEWNDQIASELEELKDYNETNFLVDVEMK